MQLKSIETADYKTVDQLIRKSFTTTEHGYENEAELVKKIRREKNYDPQLEIVAINNSQIIGHGLLSEVQINSQVRQLTGLVLAPLAVLPTQQQKGIGSAILQELEKRATQLGYPFISILGHPSYYHKFGYVSARQFDVTPPFPLPEEAFMLKELLADSLTGISGTLIYSSAFE